MKSIKNKKNSLKTLNQDWNKKFGELEFIINNNDLGNTNLFASIQQRLHQLESDFREINKKVFSMEVFLKELPECIDEQDLIKIQRLINKSERPFWKKLLGINKI